MVPFAAGNVDMRALKIAGAAVAAIVVMLALLLIIGIPSGFLTSAIQDRVERETGYRLTIAGSTRIGLWPSLNVTLSDITLQDPKDRDGSNRVTVESLQADTSLSSLWSGHPQDQRACRHQAGALCAAAARAQPRARPERKARSFAGRCQRGYDRSRDHHRRHDRLRQPARPGGEPDRRHQCRSHYRRRPQDQADGNARAQAPIRSNSTSRRPRRRASGRTCRPNSCSTRPACCRRRCRPGPRSGSTARW